MIENIIELENYLSILKKKLKGFVRRAPIFVFAKVNPTTVELSGDVDEIINIDFNKSVEDFIYDDIKTLLREKYYPKLTYYTFESKKAVFSKDLEQTLSKKDISFDDAIKQLTEVPKIANTAIIDKIDISKNRIILYGLKNSSGLFQSSIPVLVLLRKLKEYNLEERSNYFEKMCKEVKAK